MLLTLKNKISFLSILLFLLHSNFVFSQEWKNLKTYQKETGNSSLQQGCWLKKDRITQNEAWSNANVFNLSSENGYLKYKTISQIRDFYKWFDLERAKKGHEIKWIGIAVTVSNELSKMDCGWIRFFIVRNKEVVDFAHEGSIKVFEFGFPRLKEVYFSNEIIKGEVANTWDYDYGKKEQCVILEPLYQKLSPKALKRLDKMAKGKGIFTLAVPNELKYVGSIEDCQLRFEYGINTVHSYNLAVKKE